MERQILRIIFVNKFFIKHLITANFVIDSVESAISAGI